MSSHSVKHYGHEQIGEEPWRPVCRAKNYTRKHARAAYDRVTAARRANTALRYALALFGAVSLILAAMMMGLGWTARLTELAVVSLPLLFALWACVELTMRLGKLRSAGVHRRVA